MFSKLCAFKKLQEIAEILPAKQHSKTFGRKVLHFKIGICMCEMFCKYMKPNFYLVLVMVGLSTKVYQF
jgi:hypothetical protein